MTLTLQDIPLAKLVPSHANVRRAGRKNGIGELAASIEAHGLLQNLTVRRAANSNFFEVIAGGRRLLALQKLVKRKALPKNAKIPCHVIEEGSVREISLAENLLQCPMHPADQYEAFAKLHTDENMTAEDIAARFGVTAAVVKQRLKLGAVSPVLMKAYREDGLNLEQLMAFTITDDHALQETVFAELSPRNDSRHAILHALTEGQVEADDRRARFVGIETYQAAGGTITRDLFDAECEGYFADAALLNRLVREKLQRKANRVLAEGWRWVTVEASFDHALTAGMRRVYPQPLPLPEAEQATLDDLQAKIEALNALDELSEEQADELDRLEAALAEIEQPEAYRPEDMEAGGAFVSLGHDAKPRIERGFIRPEDLAKIAEGEGEEDADLAEGAETEERPALSDKLVAELTGYRTSALRNALAENPAMALNALVHALALPAFYHLAGCPSCVDVSVRSKPLNSFVNGFADSPAERANSGRHDAWGKRLPADPEELWAFILAMKEADRLALLAHCVAQGVDAVQEKGIPRSEHSGVLAKAVALDMVPYWQPTAVTYFGRVSKQRILEAVLEGVTPEAADNLASLKKADMAAAAEQRLAGKGWLPELLRS